jgi:hypothetical protein
VRRFIVYGGKGNWNVAMLAGLILGARHTFSRKVHGKGSVTFFELCGHMFVREGW